jgi:hypothetical protein
MRADLLELSLPILTELANAGLVKRAQRELEQGLFGEPLVESDTVSITATDGNRVVFAPGSGLDGTCTCGAAVCRHRIGAVLRYQQWSLANVQEPAEGPTPSDETETETEKGTETETETETVEDSNLPPTLPTISDDVLAQAVAPRTIATAKRRRAEGYLASVIHANDEDPCIVELGSVSVRFLLGADLRYARCNCKVRSGCEHIVLAAGGPEGFGSATINDELSGLSVNDAVFGLVELVLNEGLAHLSPAFAVRVAGVRRLSERTRQQWISLLLDRLVDSHVAIDQRASVDIGAVTGEILTGLIARYRAAAASDSNAQGYTGPPSAVVLGTDERSETALAQIRFTGAGARVRAGNVPGSCVVEVLLIDPTTSMVVMCRRLFRPQERTARGTVPTIGAGSDTVEQTGPLVANRSIVKGAAVRTMASGGIVTNAAVRRVDRTIEFRTGGLRHTSVTSGGATSTRFRDAGIVTEPSLVLAALEADAPAVLAPLITTYGIAAFAIATLESAFFDPAQQMVLCEATTIGGETLLIRSTYSDLTPGAPAALALFAAHEGGGTVVGHVRVEGSNVLVEPTLLGLIRADTDGDAVLLPDLYDPDGVALQALAALPSAHFQSDDSAVHQAIANAVHLVDELAIRGVRNAGPLDRELTDAAAVLARAGLSSLAKQLKTLAEAVRAAAIGARDATATMEWADAAIALRVASTMRL